MSNLLDLPEEIFILIINHLDIKSMYNLYKTCKTLKIIIVMQGVIKVCNLSLNTLATAKSLQLGMIKDIAGHLHELNMCGVSDLRKNLLLPAITRMKCLKTLDVSHTNITILDLLELYMKCPTINSISIDFKFKNPDIVTISNTTLHECQEVFKNFVNVHFVLKTWLSNLPLHVLKKSKLNNLKYTVCDESGKVFHCEDIDPMFSFNHFSIFILDWEFSNVFQGTWLQLLPPQIKLDNIEFIVMEYDSAYSICTSPTFVNFFVETFKITPCSTLDVDKKMYGNVAILIWNKETTVFDEHFYSDLKKKIKELYTCTLQSDNEQALDIDTQCYDWFSISPTEPISTNSQNVNLGPGFKKRRTVQTSKVLDYDNIFSQHKHVKLNLCVSIPSIVTLSASSSYLKKLSHLSLSGPLVRYSNEFFNILFRCCENLITLNVEGSSVSPCCSPVMRSIPLSRSLKNIRLLDKRIDFKMLFSSFSQCKTLENICVIDGSSEFNELADPVALYSMCPNLYNVSIYASVKSSIEKKMQSLVSSLIKKHGTEHHINFNVCNNSHGFSIDGSIKFKIYCLSYNPYVHVFSLKPIKPV